jgi:hypothetical protein
MILSSSLALSSLSDLQYSASCESEKLYAISSLKKDQSNENPNKIEDEIKNQQAEEQKDN